MNYRQHKSTFQPKRLIQRSVLLQGYAVILSISSLYFLPFGLGAYMVVIGIIVNTFQGQLLFMHQFSLITPMLYCWMAVGITSMYVYLITILTVRHKHDLERVYKKIFNFSIVFFIAVSLLSLSPIFMIAGVINYYYTKSIHSIFMSMVPED